MRDILSYSDRSVAPDRLTCNDRPATALSSINISDSYTYLAISTSTQRTPPQDQRSRCAILLEMLLLASRFPCQRGLCVSGASSSVAPSYASLRCVNLAGRVSGTAIYVATRGRCFCLALLPASPPSSPAGLRHVPTHDVAGRDSPLHKEV